MKQIFGWAMLLAVAAFAAYAAEGGGGGGPGGPPKRPPPGMLVKFILDHKDALNLTADQVTQLEALAKKGPDHKPGDKPPVDGQGQGQGPGQGKGPPPPPPQDGQGPGAGQGGGKGPGGPAMQILTDDQKEKLKELLKAEHPGGPGPGGGGGGGGGGGNKPPKN